MMEELKKRSWLQIDSFEDLINHEEVIVARIAEIPNGGNLFLANPFMLLEDIGVELSENVKAEIVKLEPSLSALSPTPFESLKRSRVTQNMQVEVKGLFRRRKK